MYLIADSNRLHAVSRCPRTVEPGFFFQGGSLSMQFDWSAEDSLAVELSYKMIRPGTIFSISGPSSLIVSRTAAGVSAV